MKRALATPELFVVLLIALLVGALSASTRLSSADVELTAGAGGSLTLSNSREGSAILGLGGMRPGDTANGTVTIGNTGTVPGDLSLSLSNLVDTPGAGGGALSGELDLVITDVTNAAAPVTVYSGKIAALPASALGTLAPSVSRTYEFRVAFPDAGPGAENAYQGSSMSVQFDWTATNNDPDTDAPETTITSAPGALVASGGATFSFNASESGSTFECSVDGAAFAPCASPASYSGFADGGHSFEVRATDAAGNTDASPAQHAWTVDTTAPTATMNDPGAYLRGTVTLTSATGDSGSGVATVTYQRSPAGAGSWTAVPAGWNTTSVADGPYDLRVVATDNAGNSTISAPVGDRRVDNTKPSLDSSAPADGATVGSAGSLQLTASEDAAGIANATLDGAPAPAPTVSGALISFSGPFADGPHTLAGELEDLAGNRRAIRVHFTVWSLAAADYPYVEKNVFAGVTTSLREASDTATVTMPADAWPSAPVADWLVLRVDPQPAAAIPSGYSAASDAFDVTAYWALSGTPVHDFEQPVQIAVDNSMANVIPATLMSGTWRAIPHVPSGQTLPASWADGFYRSGSDVVVLTRHLSFFTLLRDAKAPTAPGGFKGNVSGKRFSLRWNAATDNSGLVAGYRVYANSALARSVGGDTRGVSMGTFRTSDGRSFQVAAVDAAGNLGPKSYALKVVPKLSRLTLAAARTALAKRGFKVGGIKYKRSTSVPAGSVISASGFGLRRAGTKIGLTVSTGTGSTSRTDSSSSPPATSSTPPPSYPGYSSSSSASPASSPQSSSVLDELTSPAARTPEANPQPTRIEPADAAAHVQGSSRLRRLLGYGFLALAVAVALFTSARLYGGGIQAPASTPDLEPLVLWDVRLLRAAAGAVRRIAGRR